MVDIFLLLLQEVKRHCIQSVWPQLVVTEQNLQEVKLHPALNVYDLILTLSHLSGLQHGLSDGGAPIFDAAQEVEVTQFQVRGTVQKVGHIEVLDVVTCYYVRVNLTNELGPFLQQKTIFYFSLSNCGVLQTFTQLFNVSKKKTVLQSFYFSLQLNILLDLLVWCCTFNISSSWSYDKTSAPTMGAHFFSVKTLRMKGSFSPWQMTMFAIWMTGSLSGSGNTPE